MRTRDSRDIQKYLGEKLKIIKQVVLIAPDSRIRYTISSLVQEPPANLPQHQPKGRDATTPEWPPFFTDSRTNQCA